jgi:hypothetical protein
MSMRRDPGREESSWPAYILAARWPIVITVLCIIGVVTGHPEAWIGVALGGSTVLWFSGRAYVERRREARLRENIRESRDGRTRRRRRGH